MRPQLLLGRLKALHLAGQLYGHRAVQAQAKARQLFGGAAYALPRGPMQALREFTQSIALVEQRARGLAQAQRQRVQPLRASLQGTLAGMAQGGLAGAKRIQRLVT